MIGHWSRVRATILLLAASLPLLPYPASAQGTGQGFLFKQPSLQLGFHAGYTRARAGGAVLNQQRRDLTLSKRDFDTSSWGLELAVRGSERLDIALDVRFSRSEIGSESRPYLENGLPILQKTTFLRVPVTVSAKYYLRDRGRSVSQFVWIPEKWAPFVGAGGGFYWYRLRQEGDFVEEPSLDILTLILESSGTTSAAHVFAGVDVSISPRLLWTVEGRYALGRATAGSAYNFEKLDLSGFQATIGLSVRF